MIAVNEWYPLRFVPLYKERLWGGRQLATHYSRSLPEGLPIGESWEITDRPEGVSVVASGHWQGRTLTDLVQRDPRGLLGEAPARQGRFPLLIKILDAREVLSVQVHPPPARAAHWRGEPKTELWYFTATDPGAEVLAGLKSGVGRAAFELALRQGTLADCFHRLPVHPGDALFLPSGRVHALGAGVLLFEIQESSDTTFRVYDWDRLDRNGQPRALHQEQALDCIDFLDQTPSLVPPAWETMAGAVRRRCLADDPLFRAHAWESSARADLTWTLPRCLLAGVARGRLEVTARRHSMALGPGDTLLLPAALEQVQVHLPETAEWWTAEPGPGREP